MTSLAGECLSPRQECLTSISSVHLQNVPRPIQSGKGGRSMQLAMTIDNVFTPRNTAVYDKRLIFIWDMISIFIHHKKQGFVYSQRSDELIFTVNM
jgi:hypothetical protein